MKLQVRLSAVLFIVAFALSVSTSSIKTVAFLSNIDLPMFFYVLGGALSVFIFFLFTVLMVSVEAWTETPGA